ITIATCVPADPESKGGSESSVKIAKADLVPTEYNLREDYRSFVELDAPYTAAFGESRSVSWSSTVSFRAARYSVPDQLAGCQVWVRCAAGEVVIVAGEGSGAKEVARHDQVGPGQASIKD